MANNRILDFHSSPEATIVSRILVSVHQAVDESFPAAEQANRHFTKTLYNEDQEKTNVERFANSEDTAKIMVSKGEPVVIPPPPVVKKSAANPSAPEPVANTPKTQPKIAAPQPAAAPANREVTQQPIPSHFSNVSQMPTGTMMPDHLDSGKRIDWGMLLTLTLLMVGVALLAFVLMNPV